VRELSDHQKIRVLLQCGVFRTKSLTNETGLSDSTLRSIRHGTGCRTDSLEKIAAYLRKVKDLIP
jgi:hypothetical protein